MVGFPSFASLRNVPSAAMVVAFLAGLALVLAAGLTQGGLAVFTDQANVTGNTFTTAACFSPCDTGFLSPTAEAADTGGDGDGYEADPTLAFALDFNRAEDRDSGTNTSTSCSDTGKDRHRFFDYGVTGLSGSTIDGIEVRLDARVNQTSGGPIICVELSWDGGSSWTAAKTTPTLALSQRTDILGSASDTWGRTWNGSTDFTNTNFRVRITDVTADTSTRFRLDWIAVNVTYTP